MYTRLLEQHNSLVKEDYKVEGYHINRFCAWVDNNANFNEGYIEIPGNETLSGHAEILELED